MNNSPLRIFFDSEIFARQVHGGISRYFAELIAHLPSHGIRPSLIVPFTFNQHLRLGESIGARGIRLPQGLRTPQIIRVAYHLSRVVDELTSRIQRHDILHHTYYNRRLCARARRVTTVVDMIPERFPDLFAEGNPHGRKQEAIARAGLILAISEHTKRDLLELHPEIRVPVVVTPLAVDHSRFSSSGTPADGDTILFVGDRGSYKNFSVFAHAAAKLLRERPDLRVLCLGGGTLTSEERLPFVQLDVASRIVQMRISDEDLPQLYREALAFVFPSRYEGFGLPILEAFASGCPAILANASCFPEIATDAAAYFNPLVADELLEVLRRVTSDSSYRSELRRKGILRARDFSWNQTAQRTAEAYRALAEQAI